jgi:hypothetical protein
MLHSRRHSPDKICHLVKYYAVELAGTIVFVAWLAKAIWHELGL